MCTSVFIIRKRSRPCKPYNSPHHSVHSGGRDPAGGLLCTVHCGCLQPQRTGRPSRLLVSHTHFIHAYSSCIEQMGTLIAYERWSEWQKTSDKPQSFKLSKTPIEIELSQALICLLFSRVSDRQLWLSVCYSVLLSCETPPPSTCETPLPLPHFHVRPTSLPPPPI